MIDIQWFRLDPPKAKIWQKKSRKQTVCRASSLGLVLKSFISLQPASSADIWRWVHSVYGDELGLTSDDEHDYVSPYVTPEGKVF